MITRRGKFLWLVRVGLQEQYVNGTIWNARAQEERLLAERAKDAAQAREKRWAAQIRMRAGA